MLGFRRARRAATLGAQGEALAARYLKRKRYRIARKNLHVGVGEADLLCLSPDRKTLVIVEVKTRMMAQGSTIVPEAAINAHKKRKLVQVAHACAQKMHWSDKPLRIDVVAIEMHQGQPPVIRHYEDAVR